MDAIDHALTALLALLATAAFALLWVGEVDAAVPALIGGFVAHWRISVRDAAREEAAR